MKTTQRAKRKTSFSVWCDTSQISLRLLFEKFESDNFFPVNMYQLLVINPLKLNQLLRCLQTLISNEETKLLLNASGS